MILASVSERIACTFVWPWLESCSSSFTLGGRLESASELGGVILGFLGTFGLTGGFGLQGARLGPGGFGFTAEVLTCCWFELELLLGLLEMSGIDGGGCIGFDFVGGCLRGSFVVPLLLIGVPCAGSNGCSPLCLRRGAGRGLGEASSSFENSVGFVSQDDKLVFEVDFPLSCNEVGGGGGGGLFRGFGTGLLGVSTSEFGLSEGLLPATLVFLEELLGLSLFDSWVSSSLVFSSNKGGFILLLI